jgi:hypothetical protein
LSSRNFFLVNSQLTNNQYLPVINMDKGVVYHRKEKKEKKNIKVSIYNRMDRYYLYYPVYPSKKVTSKSTRAFSNIAVQNSNANPSGLAINRIHSCFPDIHYSYDIKQSKCQK